MVYLTYTNSTATYNSSPANIKIRPHSLCCEYQQSWWMWPVVYRIESSAKIDKLHLTYQQPSSIAVDRSTLRCNNYSNDRRSPTATIYNINQQWPSSRNKIGKKAKLVTIHVRAAATLKTLRSINVEWWWKVSTEHSWMMMRGADRTQLNDKRCWQNTVEWWW